MALFKYRVADTDGSIKKILIEGDSHSDSLARLRSRGLVPLDFYGENAVDDDEGLFDFGFKRRFDVCEFTNMLVPLLKAHVPLEQALGIISKSSPNDHFTRVVNDIRRGLHEGKKFSHLVRESGAGFPKIFSNLAEAGEETGSLAEVMTELRRFLNERREMKNFLLTSSIYPVFVITVVVGVVIMLFTVFIPKFSRIFIEMNKPLPLITKCIFAISSVITGFWWLWLTLFIALLLFLAYLRKKGILSILWDEYILKVPLFGRLVIMTEISRFIRTLSVLIRNHVHMLNTVNIAASVVGNSVISRSFSTVPTELRGGKKLSAALAKSRFMPITVLQMISVGEESGNLGDMLDQVASSYEEQLRNNVKRLLALFEPVVILVLAAIIMLVVLSVILAILELQNI
jgi:type II secretory pathway component PulF